MALGMSAAGANAALGALAAAYTWIKPHVGDPGSAGTANPATETTRKQITWNSPSAAGLDGGALAWSAAAATGTEDWTHFTAWSASTGGTFGFSGQITAPAFTAGTDVSVAAGACTVTYPTAS